MYLQHLSISKARRKHSIFGTLFFAVFLSHCKRLRTQFNDPLFIRSGKANYAYRNRQY